jgi:hypothetical protein
MKRFIVFSALGSLLAAPLASAGPPHWTPPGHRGPPPPAYGYYYPAYSYHRYKGGSDSDDAAWAIGGLVLGAIIGTAAARAESREVQATAPEPSSTPLPPPQKRKVVTCYDEVAYDQKGDPYVARQCYENWR